MSARVSVETPERRSERQWALTMMAVVLDSVRKESVAAGNERLFYRLSEFVTDPTGTRGCCVRPGHDDPSSEDGRASSESPCRESRILQDPNRGWEAGTKFELRCSLSPRGRRRRVYRDHQGDRYNQLIVLTGDIDRTRRGLPTVLA
jgi:hypothetical protein